VGAAIERAQVVAPRHTVQRELADDLPVAAWDADRVSQVLDNLLLNAVQYTPAGGVVRVRAEAAGDVVRIIVADEGRGIPPEDLPRIFEPFYRAASARVGRAQGMGLGLPISKALVEAHGGTLAVESAVGRGTTFTVTLPVQREAG
jgi:two-component system phosphate regulon sensor histidine kinase PhoR